MTRATPFAGRLRWYLRALGFNPLIRATDRVEALAVLAVFVAALFAAPVAMSAGTMVYESGMRTAAEQAATRHPVDALVVEGTGLPTDYDTPAYVRAEWRDGTRLRTQWVPSPATIKAGDRMVLWLDDRGTVVAAPLTPGDARLNAGMAVGSSWVALVSAAALAAYLVRRRLDVLRDRAWDRDLEHFANRA